MGPGQPGLDQGEFALHVGGVAAGFEEPNGQQETGGTGTLLEAAGGRNPGRDIGGIGGIRHHADHGVASAVQGHQPA